MADSYGNAPIDVAVAEDEAAVSDPVLDTLLSFFAAVLNAHGGDAWSGLTKRPGVLLVKKVRAHDPARTAFIANDAPALYLWRESIGKARQIAADWRIRPSKLTLRWVPFATYTQEIKRRWDPFFNAVPSILDAAIELGHDPAWIAPGDDDPRAPTRGSLLWKYVKAHKLEIAREDVARSRFLIPIEGDREPIVVDSLDVPIDLEERLDRDPARYAELSGVGITVPVPRQ